MDDAEPARNASSVDVRTRRALANLVMLVVPLLVVTWMLPPVPGDPAGARAAAPAPTTLPSASVPPTAGTSLWPSAAPTWFETPGPPTAPAIPPGVEPAATAAPATTPKPSTPPATSTPKPTPKPTKPPSAAACTVFPADNVWNRRIDDLPVHPKSDVYVEAIGLGKSLHPDFSSLAWNDGLGYGIPTNKVNLSTPRHSVEFYYADESDPGPYPIPADPRIEGGSDRHLIAWDTEDCRLYEIFDASTSGGSWFGGSGAIWNLRSNKLRPNGWTSADAAGLPILAGLVRWDEVHGGAIRHALRFTAPRTCPDHIHPARHHAGSWSCDTYPPMGLRVRLKADVDISGFGPQARVILVALKRYGMLLADNGSAWYVTGAPHANWDDDELHDLHDITGTDFEVVDTSGFR